MRKIEEYKYQVYLSGDFELSNNCRGHIFEKQLAVYNCNELLGDGNSEQEVPLWDTTKSMYFYIENILGDFLSNGQLFQFRDLKRVILNDDWYKNPIFLNQTVPSPLCDSKDTAEDIWMMVYELFENTNGLKNITLNEFDRLCAYKNLSLKYSLKYCIKQPWIEKERILESDIIKGNTEEYTPKYVYECNNSKEIVVALLHYCILNHYELKQCKLCGKYFIPRKRQEQYCLRPFIYKNWQNKEKSYTSCKQARESIAKTNKERYKKIENRLSKRKDEYGMLPNDSSKKDYEDFTETAKKYLHIISNNPCIDNLKKYETYLYVECKKYDVRYARR